MITAKWEHAGGTEPGSLFQLLGALLLCSTNLAIDRLPNRVWRLRSPAAKEASGGATFVDLDCRSRTLTLRFPQRCVVTNQNSSRSATSPTFAGLPPKFGARASTTRTRAPSSTKRRAKFKPMERWNPIPRSGWLPVPLAQIQWKAPAARQLSGWSACCYGSRPATHQNEVQTRHIPYSWCIFGVKLHRIDQCTKKAIFNDPPKHNPDTAE